MTQKHDDPNKPVRLSARQHEVAQYLAEGMTDAEIATELGISPRTVRMHCDALRMKLGVPRRRYIPFAYRSLVGTDPFVISLRPQSEHG